MCSAITENPYDPWISGPLNHQAVLQGVPFRGVQVVRWKRLVLLHEKNGLGNRKNEVKLRPFCPDP